MKHRRLTVGMLTGVAFAVASTAAIVLAATHDPPSASASAAPAGSGSATLLPDGWLGVWTGTMNLTGPTTDGGSTVAVRLQMTPIDDEPGAVAWVMTYGSGATEMVKDYRLRRDPAHPDRADRLVMDEQNGVMLASRLTGGVLYSHFTVGETWLTSRQELRGGTMHFEVTSAARLAEGGVRIGEMDITSFQINAVQAVEMTRTP